MSVSLQSVPAGLPERRDFVCWAAEKLHATLVILDPSDGTIEVGRLGVERENISPETIGHRTLAMSEIRLKVILTGVGLCNRG